MVDAQAPNTFELSAPLGDASYANAFYTVLGNTDVTINFLCTKPIIGKELEDANARNATVVRPVASIVLTHSMAAGLAAQLAQMLEAMQGGT